MEFQDESDEKQEKDTKVKETWRLNFKMQAKCIRQFILEKYR